MKAVYRIFSGGAIRRPRTPSWNSNACLVDFSFRPDLKCRMVAARSAFSAPIPELSRSMSYWITTLWICASTTAPIATKHDRGAWW